MENNNDMIFDCYGPITESRKEFLDRLLPELIRSCNLKTALDVGCGVGFFSEYLHKLGLNITALDARPENIAEAKKRYPNIQFHLYNIEEPEIQNLGSIDLLLCFGLLYHLENPFRAIRNLYELTKKLVIIETMVSPNQLAGATFVDENHEIDQSLQYIALVPSETGFVKMLYRAGFESVYKPKKMPNQNHFRETLKYRRRRTILVASKTTLNSRILNKLTEPPAADIWHKKWGFRVERILKFFGKPLHL